MTNINRVFEGLNEAPDTLAEIAYRVGLSKKETMIALYDLLTAKRISRTEFDGQILYGKRVKFGNYIDAPAILNQITAKVFRYHPKPKTKAAKRWIRKARRTKGAT